MTPDPPRSADAQIFSVGVNPSADLRALAMLGAAAAQNPSTNPSKLMRLSRSRNALLRELVAQNSSTPPTTLDALTSDRDPKVIRAVAGNLSTPQTALEQLVRSRSESIRAAAYGNPSTAPGVLAGILEARGATIEEKVAAAGNPSTPDSTLARITWHNAPGPVMLAVASNGSASAKTLSDLFGGRSLRAADRAFCAAIASNPAAPTAVRARLFRVEEYRSLILATKPDEAKSTRIAHARSRYNDGGSILELLAHDLESDVRRAVAVSPWANDEILSTIESDSVLSVATVARARRAADLVELRRLALLKDPLVLEALARNPHTPVDIRPRLAREITGTASDDLLEALARDSSTPSDVLMALSTNKHKGVRQAVASSPMTPLEVMIRLTFDSDPSIRSRAASVSGLPINELVRLASDDDPSVRAAVAKSNVTPPELLVCLATDDTPAVAEAVASNSHSTPAILARVVSAQLDRWKSRAPRPSYAQAREGFPMGPCAAAAANGQTPTESLRAIVSGFESNLVEQLLYHPHETGRRFTAPIWTRLAGNPSAPADSLESIARRVRKDLRSTDRPNSGIQDLEQWREGILRAIVLNPSTGVETLEFLSDASWVARKTHKVSDREAAHGYLIEWDGSATRSATADTARSIRSELIARRWKNGGAPGERMQFAIDPDASNEILAILAEDPLDDVRGAVAANPSTSADTFSRLVNDSSVAVRVAAAKATHPDPASRVHEPYGRQTKNRESDYRAAFEALAQDEHEQVRAAITKNAPVFWHTMSKTARSQMVVDGGPQMRAEVAASFSGKDVRGLSTKALRSLIMDGDEEMWRALAKSYYQLPAEILERLVDTKDSVTVVQVANVAHASDELLVRLASGDDEAVFNAVASRRDSGYGRDHTRELLAQALLRNPRTPEQVITQLATGALGDKVLELIARHPRLPEATLVDHAKGDDLRWLRIAARSGSSLAVAAVASNIHAPSELLQFIAATGDIAAREALILNANTSRELLVTLIEVNAQSQ